MKKAFLTVSVVLLIGGLSAYRYYDRGYAREAQAAPTAGERIYVESCAACHGKEETARDPRLID
jgi:mono/diheme cytochrome c family protein